MLKTWRCVFCMSKKNLANATTCAVCKIQRQPDRIGLHYNGAHYLCRTNTSHKIPTVTIFRVFPLPELQFKTIVHMNGKDIIECVHEAIDSYFEDERKQLLSPPPTFSKVPSIEFFNTNKSFENLESIKNRDLFEDVINSSTTLAYDGKIGQYINIDSLFNMDPEYIKTGFAYTTNMTVAKREIKKIVDDIIYKRDEGDDYVDENKLFYEQRKSLKRQNCGLCELNLPIDSLIASTSFKTISKWRENHDVPFLSNDRRLMNSNIHKEMLICLFCVQFIDKNFCDVIGSIATEVHYDEETTKMHNRSIRTSKSNSHHSRAIEEISRPISRIEQKISISKLKLRAELAKTNFYVQEMKKTSKIVDSNAAGTFLRDKYCNVSLIYFV